MDLFLQKIEEEGEVYYNITTAGYTLLVVLILLAVVAVSFFVNKDGKGKMSAKQLAVSALCLALAFVLSNFKLGELPNGGSITVCSMFFITYIGYLYGPRVGLSSAFAYGLLQMIIDPYIISVPQLICDYILAFMALGIAGFFTNTKRGMLWGFLAGAFGRFVFATLSGVIFFAAYAPEGMSPLLYSVLYNGSYISVEVILTIVVVFCVPATRSIMTKLKYDLSNNTNKKAAKAV